MTRNSRKFRPAKLWRYTVWEITVEQQVAIGRYAYLHGKGAWQLAGTYENKNTKISSEGLTTIYTKICTYQNFLLYGN